MRVECLEVIKLNKVEWKILNEITYSWTIRELSRKTNLPFSTLYRYLKSLRAKGSIIFQPDYRKMNLLPTCMLIPDTPLKEVPTFTFSLRKVYGLKPYILITALLPPSFINKYLNSLDADILFIVRGYEYLRWQLNTGFTLYFPNEGLLLPVFDNVIHFIKEASRPIEKWEESLDSPDVIDLAIIQKKMRDPFIRAKDAIEQARKVDPTFPRITKQAISYHVKKHVKNMWLGNTIHFFFDTSHVPMRIYYFEGKDAAAVARTLVNIPGFFNAVIDDDKSLVVGQPPCHIHENIHKLFSMFDIDMPLGDIIISSSNISNTIPWLWRYTKDGVWIWRDEKLKVIVK